jgi:alpha-amylase
MIPFKPPQDTIDYLSQLAARQPGAIVVFGDDGEKFGAWPETKKHVYEDGWLVQLFDLLAQNESWIKSVTPSEVIDSTPPGFNAP